MNLHVLIMVITTIMLTAVIVCTTDVCVCLNMMHVSAKVMMMPMMTIFYTQLLFYVLMIHMY